MAFKTCISFGDDLPFEDMGDGHRFECAACRSADSQRDIDDDDDDDDD
jgi:hypothetical protein